MTSLLAQLDLATIAAWVFAQAVVATPWIATALVVEHVLSSRLSPEWREALWWLVVARLVVPVSMTASWGLWGSAAQLAPGQLTLELGAVAKLAEPGWLAGTWAAIALTCAARFLAVQRRHHRAVIQRAKDATEVQPYADAIARSLRLRAVPILRDAHATGPYVYGALRPRIVLPPAALSLGAADMDAVLTHELMHVRRRDLWRQTLLTVLTCVFWFHPLLWWMRRRAHLAREMGCDARVAARSNDSGLAYRRALLRLATSSSLPVGAGLGHSRAIALQRVVALERFAPSGHRVRTCAALSLLVVTAVALLPRAVEATRIAPLDAQARLSSLLQGSEDVGGLQLRYAAWAVRSEAASAGSKIDDLAK